jgi:azurin
MTIKSFLSVSLLALAGVFALASSASAAAAPREVTITSNDAMQYNLKEIAAKPGETIRLTLKHIGKLPKTAMGHNWVLVKPMTPAEFNAFAMSCVTKAPVYLPDDRSAVLAHTKIIGGGESDTIEFTVPATAGDYPFLCTFPGHYAMMKGVLKVK